MSIILQLIMASVITITLPFNALYGSPSTYDVRQRTFVEKSQEIVQEASEKLLAWKEEGKPSIDVFHSLLQYLADQRQQLAREAGTRDAEQFGKWQTDCIDTGEMYPRTELIGTYEKINRIAIQRLIEELKPLKHDLKQFHETTKKTSEFVLGKHFSCEVEILSGKDLKERKWDTALLKSESMEIIDKFKQEQSEGSAKQFFQFYKRTSPELYKRGKMQNYLQRIFEIFPSPTIVGGRLISGNTGYLKSDFILVTLRTEIDGKMYATNQLLTWAYRDYERDPIDRMADNSVITVVHQDILLHEVTLKECARLFAEILEKGDEKTPEELIEQISLLRYMLAQTMPFMRGSAAIQEWLEESLYKALGYSCTYTESKNTIDLTALTALRFSEFLAKYKEIVHIQK